MSRKRIKPLDIEDARAEGADEGLWLSTLSDMMMLLLTFFVMLFAITSSSDENHVGTLRKIGDALGGKSIIEKKSGIEELEENLESFIKDNNLVRQINLTSDTRGITMYAEGDLFFNSGTSDLRSDIKLFLKRTAGIIKESGYKVLVEGHTDDVPISTPRFPSNWDLSSARASSVVRFFIEDENLEPKRFSAVGYAHYKPRYPMIPENRSKNRRVEIIILREKI